MMDVCMTTPQPEFYHSYLGCDVLWNYKE